MGSRCDDMFAVGIGHKGGDDRLQEQRGETTADYRKGTERVCEGSWVLRPSSERGRGWDVNLLQKRTRERRGGRGRRRSRTSDAGSNGVDAGSSGGVERTLGGGTSGRRAAAGGGRAVETGEALGLAGTAWEGELGRWAPSGP
jgi:hypothetical protein